jgi:hypothetical protein
MLTGISAPTAWPFFQHHGRATVALGTSVGGPGASLTLAGINLAPGDLLLVGTGSDLAGTATDVSVDINGVGLDQDGAEVDAGVFVLCSMNSRLIPAAIVGGTITASWPVADPDNMVMLARKVSNLAGLLEEEVQAGFGFTTTPDSGGTAIYAAPGFHWGLVCCLGRALDTLGTWQFSMTAGQRASTVAIKVDLKEGYRIPAAPAAARAHLHAQTSRRSVALAAYYS